MKNVLKSRWFMISLTAGITAVVTSLVNTPTTSIRCESDSSGRKSDSTRISYSTACNRVANYGKWAGKMSKEILNIAHSHDPRVQVGCMPDSFITYWTIEKEEIDSFIGDNKSATGVRLFLSFEDDALFTQLTSLNYTDKPTKEDSTYFVLLQNIAKVMKTAHLVMEPILSDHAPIAYFDLIEPCPSLCDKKNSVLYPEYTKGFTAGYE